MQKPIKVYGYRWVVLAAFMLISVMIQIQWLTHAPVARAAEEFYAGQFNPASIINIDFLAMLYMLIYLVICIPASYIIDTYGIRTGISIGASLAGVCALLKGIFAASFTGVLITQIGLSIAQPFILNAVTAVSVRWFPLEERGLAAGLSALAQYIGIIIAMGVTPLLIGTNPDAANYGSGFERMLMIYGSITLAAAVLAILLIREAPPTPHSKEKLIHKPFFEGIKHILRQRDMIIMIILFFIGLGIFNAVSSMVDSIAADIGVKDSNGMIGVLMLVGGVIGAIILPLLSDKMMRRKLFLVICIAGMIPGTAGLAFAGRIGVSPAAAYSIALGASFILGFFVMSAGPIGFQYAAEVSYPAPESTSQGFLLLSGQITGLLFVAGMSIRDNALLPGFMTVFTILAIAAFICVILLKESPMTAQMAAERKDQRHI